MFLRLPSTMDRAGVQLSQDNGLIGRYVVGTDTRDASNGRTLKMEEWNYENKAAWSSRGRKKVSIYTNRTMKRSTFLT
jgi:hypothetical protein